MIVAHVVRFHEISVIMGHFLPAVKCVDHKLLHRSYFPIVFSHHACLLQHKRFLSSPLPIHRIHSGPTNCCNHSAIYLKSIVPPRETKVDKRVHKDAL